MPTSKQMPLRINFSWMLVGNIVYAISNWAILSVLARLGNPAEVGRFALALSITAPLMLLSQMALRQVQVTDNTDDFRFGDYVLLRLLTTALALVAILFMALTHEGDASARAVILLVGCAKAFEAISDIHYGLFQKHERLEWVARSTMLRGLVPLLLLGGSYVLSDNLPLSVGCYALGKLAVFLYDLRIRRKHFDAPKRQNTTDWRAIGQRLTTLLWVAFPLGIVSSMISAITAIPRVTLEAEYGAAALGIFSSIAYLIVTGNMVVNALGQSALPRLTKLYAQAKRKRFVALLLKLIAIGMSLGVGGVLLSMLIGPFLLNLLYGPEYAAENHILVWLALSAIFTFAASFLGYAITAARYFRAQLVTMSLVLAATFALSWWIVPQYGLEGAAIVVILSSGVRLVIASIVAGFIIRRFPTTST